MELTGIQSTGMELTGGEDMELPQSMYMPQGMLLDGEVLMGDEACWVYVPSYDLTMVEADKDEFIKAIRRARGM
ncbi:hypothetical protein CLAFUW4_14280 [Fulvia fulva]|uniref:Uncharacterized protein n=1 Tax=Passalora fulva TaxID=5499 RepID=A0A9Q8PLW1_PASFU|nr:uncharacterized protein CLAFUR5_14113 [Fulvia fulva]KAK4609218.1 hypothetical protein CLAFUR4_14280 [Fulvia fulva]KAK4609736.1 hypothetical protein CLAFUR0_14284 [Fulvia fulva]UJO25019.1 hypothetical protein CLAFUR5_14113 [Fulvia fulva]WPV22909.1 hypothetical protein CLAFUW4_14280 [Fulvia fulva]WPV37432.1 hypothetical protein CLAFUW7_14288 [Fulvia fulva]